MPSNEKNKIKTDWHSKIPTSNIFYIANAMSNKIDQISCHYLSHSLSHSLQILF